MENYNSNRKLVHKSVISDLLKTLNESLTPVKSELTNTREVPDEYKGLNFIEINKSDLNRHVDGVISVLKAIKLAR